jgi:hypothetical protein
MTRPPSTAHRRSRAGRLSSRWNRPSRFFVQLSHEIATRYSTGSYNQNLWITHLSRGAAYLPR